MSEFTTPRITEKRYLKIPPIALTANGTVDGLIEITSTYCFKVGQCVLFKQGITFLKAKVQRVISETEFIVIEVSESIITKKKLDMSAFLIGATVELMEVKRPVIDILEIQRQVYEEEPTVALRTHDVDFLGRSYGPTNPTWAVDYLVEVAFGNVPGTTLFRAFGRNSQIDRNTREDIWDFGGTYVYPTAATVLDIVSDNINDVDTTGTGAHKVLIEGLDANFIEISETISLNGTSTVNSTLSFFRINLMSVVESGNSNLNEGHITAEIAGNTIGSIQPTFTQSQAAIFSVPAGKTAIFNGINLSVGPAKNSGGIKRGEALLLFKVGNVDLIRGSVYLNSDGNTSFFGTNTISAPIPEKTDIRVSFLPDENNCLVTAAFNLVLRDN